VEAVNQKAKKKKVFFWGGGGCKIQKTNCFSCPFYKYYLKKWGKRKEKKKKKKKIFFLGGGGGFKLINHCTSARTFLN